MKGQLWRWVNVTVVVPEGSAVAVGRGMIPADLKGAGGPGMDLTVSHEGGTVSYLVIDAANGDVVLDKVAEEDHPAIDVVLDSLSVSSAGAPLDVWPYATTLPAGLARTGWGRISYLVPDPSAGVQVTVGIGDTFSAGYGAFKYIQITNGRSVAGVVDDGGSLFVDMGMVLAEDRSAFERYIATVELCQAESVC